MARRTFTWSGHKIVSSILFLNRTVNRSRPHSPDERVYVGIVRESKEYIIKIAKSIVSGQEYGVASFNCQDVAHKILVALGLGDKGPTRNWFALLLPFGSSSSAPMVRGNNTY